MSIYQRKNGIWYLKKTANGKFLFAVAHHYTILSEPRQGQYHTLGLRIETIASPLKHR